MTGYQSKRAAAQDKLESVEREALKLALDTLDEVRSETFRLLRNGQTLYAEEKVWSTIVAIKKALAQPEQEQNFCPRCGKRTADLTTIHTCTPPRENK
jgi:hypothetical protein